MSNNNKKESKMGKKEQNKQFLLENMVKHFN